jgi:DNA polymerase gamma 1
MKLISKKLHERLYGHSPEYVERDRYCATMHEKFGTDKAVDASDETELTLPNWVSTANETLDKAAEYVAGSAKKALVDVSNWEVPAVPEHFINYEGWVKFEDGEWRVSSAPCNKTLMVDTETVQIENVTIPVCCLMYDGTTWHSWANTSTAKESKVPDGHGNIYIAHNAAYDRAQLASSYHGDICKPSNTWFCTMSMLTAVRGMSNQQVAMYKSDNSYAFQGWETEATMLGLDAALRFYTGVGVDKSVRGDIWREGLGFWASCTLDVLEYCAKDVRSTIELARHLLPEFFHCVPSLTSLAGLALVGSETVFLSDRWDNYSLKSEATYTDSKSRLSDIIVSQFQQTPSVYTSYLDWTPTKNSDPEWLLGLKRKLGAKTKKLASPNWRESVALLKMAYFNKPIVWYSGGWHFVSSMEATDYRLPDATDIYEPLPHPEKRGEKLTKLFCKGNIHLFTDGALTSHIEGGVEVVELLAGIINWESLKQRVADVQTVRTEHGLVHIPDDVPYGTITRRKGGKLFPVAPNPKKGRLGTEIKSMMSAPPGYSFVHCDYDSQEAVTFSLLGDMYYGSPGSTPLSVAVNIGQKQQKTDIHSIQAKETGMGRDTAKNLVYAAFYGQGTNSATEYILKGNPSLSREQAQLLAKKFHTSLKGEKTSYGSYRGGMASESYNAIQRIVNSADPRTPFLGARIPLSLSTQEFQTTRDNWLIQSTGRDMLDAIITLISYGSKEEGLTARLAYTCHDEFLFVCPDTESIELAEIVMHAHLVVYACVCASLELDSVPCARKYPEAVEVDRVWRKSIQETCTTPSSDAALDDTVALTVADF